MQRAALVAAEELPFITERTDFTDYWTQMKTIDPDGAPRFVKVFRFIMLFMSPERLAE